VQVVCTGGRRENPVRRLYMNDAKGGRRYAIHVRAEEAFGHKGVVFWLFHEDTLPEEVYEQLIPAHLDRSSPNLRSAVEQTFDGDEVRQLRAYFGRHGEQVTVEEVEGPLGEHDFGDQIRSVGGNDGFYEFSGAADWDLPFRVSGFFNLHYAESGPYKDRRESMEAFLGAFRHDVMRAADGHPANVYTRPTEGGDIVRAPIADVVREAGGNPEPPADDGLPL
jgi:hypothetical protein